MNVLQGLIGSNVGYAFIFELSYYSVIFQFPLIYREEELSRIADRVFHEADDNSDGNLSFEEFAEATKHIDIERRMSFLSLGQ